MSAPSGFIVVHTGETANTPVRIAVAHIVRYGVRHPHDLHTTMVTSDCVGDETIPVCETPEQIDRLIQVSLDINSHSQRAWQALIRQQEEVLGV